MILTVNIGNTHITVGGYEQDTLIFCGRLHSDPAATVEEYAIRLVNLLQLYGASPAQIEGGILGSVVPMLSGRVLAALQLLCKARILTVGPGLKSGIKLRLDNPAQLGAELLCGAVAALAECPGPLVVISADTAISLMAVNAKQELVGGVILPGPQLSMNALVQKTAQLPQIDPAARASDSVLGKSTLTWSAQFFEEDEPEKNIADQKKKAKKPEQKETVSDAVTENVDGKADATDTKEKKSGAAESIAVGGTVALSILMAVAIFIVLPYFLSMLFSHYVLNESLLAIVEGVLRIVIFVAYVAGISAMKDIRRVYMYHGAEHKCINCIERGRELTVKNVRKSSRLHKRCGTSFLLFVMLVSIVLFLFIRVQNPLLRLGLRILLIPVIAGISYELIRLAGRSDNFLVRIISAPGMWLQRLTTKEPDDSMIEVAIASVEAVFDWKAYLKETFGYDVEDWEKQDAAAKAQETEDAEAADGMEAGKAAAEESREQ